jgi:hypothetical protein
MEFASYESLAAGTEGVIEDVSAPAAGAARPAADHRTVEWSLWTWTGAEIEAGPEIEFLNGMQERLGVMDDETRRLRAHIASLAHCDNGFPVTVDELLEAIGRGGLPKEPFHNGCFWSFGWRSTQPGQVESMRVIDTVLRRYVAGGDELEVVDEFPFAAGFITRAFEWLGPAAGLTAVQRLLLARMMLPFEYFTKRNRDHVAVHEECFGPDGQGAAIDAQIAALAGLPRVFPNYRPEFRAHLESIDDPRRRALYQVCGAIAHGVRELSDCHHSTFRWIERWIHAIGTGMWEIASRREGTERARIGRLLLGYTLALDRWLLGLPMQFLLLDLGHVDLGFDPKNQVLGVYAHLGEEREPVKEWLVACMWYRMYHMLHLRDYYVDHVNRAAAAGVGLRHWFEGARKA